MSLTICTRFPCSLHHQHHAPTLLLLPLHLPQKLPHPSRIHLFPPLALHRHLQALQRLIHLPLLHARTQRHNPAHLRLQLIAATLQPRLVLREALVRGLVCLQPRLQHRCGRHRRQRRNLLLREVLWVRGGVEELRIDLQARVGFADLDVFFEDAGGAAAGEFLAVDGVGAAEGGALLAEVVARDGALLEGGEAAALFGEAGGGFAELGVGLVDEGLFLLKLGFEGGRGFGEEVLHGWRELVVSGCGLEGCCGMDTARYGWGRCEKGVGER